MHKTLALLGTGFAGLALAAAGAFSPSSAHADSSAAPVSLTGSWTLVAADVVHPDGSRSRDYGAAPQGLLIVDAQGRYSLQIYKAERPRFASGDKASGTPAEYQAASLGASTHFGTLSIDPGTRTLTFHIQAASFPNWEGAEQKRHYELHDDELTYSVPARPDGNTPISVWKRVGSP